VDDLSRLSDGLAAVVEATGPGIVRVDARRRWPGSGIVWAPEGVVVTADHIVEREERIEVGLPDGTALPATLVGRDPATDVAVLRIQATGMTTPAWANPDGLRVGQVLLALARPGRTVRAAFGILSAFGESWRTPAGGEIDRYVQADLRLPPGFSGGPLVDAGGKVRGLATSGLLRGMSVAVPAPTLRRVVDMLLAYGRVRRGYLGVGAHPVRLPDTLAQQSGQGTGLIVISVEGGSPAERGGLVLGDVILTVEGQRVHRLDDLMALLRADRVGATVPVRIARGGQLQELRVVIGERAA
jgi:S1-C subfamily serine protease